MYRQAFTDDGLTSLRRASDCGNFVPRMPFNVSVVSRCTVDTDPRLKTACETPRLPTRYKTIDEYHYALPAYARGLLFKNIACAICSIRTIGLQFLGVVLECIDGVKLRRGENAPYEILETGICREKYQYYDQILENSCFRDTYCPAENQLHEPCARYFDPVSLRDVDLQKKTLIPISQQTYVVKNAHCAFCRGADVRLARKCPASPAGAAPKYLHVARRVAPPPVWKRNDALKRYQLRISANVSTRISRANTRMNYIKIVLKNRILTQGGANVEYLSKIKEDCSIMDCDMGSRPGTIESRKRCAGSGCDSKVGRRTFITQIL